MSRIVKIKAKQKPKDNSIELSFVTDDTDLSRYDILSEEFFSPTPDMAIISYVTTTYMNTNIDFDPDRNPKLYLIMDSCYGMEEFINSPIAIYTVTTNKSNTIFDGMHYYSIINYDNYSIKKRITTLNELLSEHNMGIYISDRFVSKDSKIDSVNDTNHCDKSDNNTNTDKDLVRDCFDPFDNASTDKNLAHITNEFKEAKYSSLATGYSDDIVSIKGRIYDTIQCRYISIILDATLRALMIPPDKIYFLNMESVKLKSTGLETKDIAKSIKAFIESQSTFMTPGSVFIPFYIDTGTKISKNLIKILIEAGFKGVWSMYMYTDDPNSNKVFEELLKMEDHK